MFRAHLGQVFREDHEGRPWDAWVIHVGHAARQGPDKEIRDRHSEVETLLSDQDVNFVELTTSDGKTECSRRFGCTDASHPVFLVLSQHPDDLEEGDLFLLIEWGSLPDRDAVAADLMTFASVFSQAEFGELLADSRSLEDWTRVRRFLDDHDFRHLAVGENVTIRRWS